MRRPVLRLLLLCTALTACAAQATTVTVAPNSCLVPTYTITSTPTTYALNLSSLPGAVGGCSATSLLCGAVSLSTPTVCRTVLRQRAEVRGLAPSVTDLCSLRCDHCTTCVSEPLRAPNFGSAHG